MPPSARPEINLHNTEALYGYYQDLEPSALVLRSLYWACSRYYGQYTGYEAGAKDRIGELVQEGASFVLTSNHLTMFDQLPVAATIQDSRIMRPLITDTFIASKIGYYKNPLVAKLLDLSGAAPIFRLDDARDDVRALALPSRHFEDYAVAKLVAGKHLYLFPEGTRSKDGGQTTQKARAILGRIVTRAAAETKLAIVTFGIYYGSNPRLPNGWRRPGIYVPRPNEGPWQNSKEVTRQITADMAHSFQEARRVREKHVISR